MGEDFETRTPTRRPPGAERLAFPPLHFMFAEGDGWIERTDATGNTIVLQLESYGPGVAAEAPTWGWVKALYQN